ncbi:response regulator [Entomobacter blattae]|uniref:Transcriptional regulatory protein OmpR n=1 Tax=Entomobacter blattae TaxID=2762277 RepID=A0A7H1NST2_9PROT|nr:response regulator transcription factor [Entomobacter blattae]QNT78842.1 Transcriptional regulatory protein OmpR [Entomobacter blattae]
MSVEIKTGAHILVVDDDLRLLRLLQRYLTEQGFRVSIASSAKEARTILLAVYPDALVVDVTMPGENGLEFTESLRKEGFHFPILLLTARGEPQDRIAGLEAGADDYLGKPFEPKELMLRLKLHIKRVSTPSPNEPSGPVKLGTLEYDPQRSLLKDKNNNFIHLTSGEAALLSLLTWHANEVLSRESIARALSLDDIGERAVDVQITRLRRRLEKDPREPQFLQTVRGKGYVLKPGG